MFQLGLLARILNFFLLAREFGSFMCGIGGGLEFADFDADFDNVAWLDWIGLTDFERLGLAIRNAADEKLTLHRKCSAAAGFTQPG